MSEAGLGLESPEALYFPSLGDLQDAAKGQQHQQATVATKGEESALSPDRIHSSHVLKQLEKLATELTTTGLYADSSAAQQQTSSTGPSSSTSARSHPPRQSVPHPNSSPSTTLSPPPTTADDISRGLLHHAVPKIDRRPLLVEWRPGVQGDRCRRLAQSALRAKPVQAAIEEICTTAKGARDETALAVAITKLLNHFGIQLQLLLAASLSTCERPSAPSTAEQPTLGSAHAPTQTDAARFADSPVRAVERGNLSVTTAGPESNRPDIVLQAKPGKVMCADLCDAHSTTGDGASDAQGQGGPHPWLFYVAAVEVKFKKSDLLATRTVGQIFRYGRQLLVGHPFAERVHVLCWAGLRVQVWQFNANAVFVSPIIEISRSTALQQSGDATAHDSLDELGKLLFLLVSGQETVLPRWTPLIPIAKQSLEHIGLTVIDREKLKLINVRYTLNGSRTVLFGTPFLNVRLKDAGTQAKRVVQQLDERDLWVFFKCCWLPERLGDHEHSILERLNGRGGAPTPLGLISLPWKTSSRQRLPSQSGENDTAPLSAYVVVFAQHRGHHIPYDADVSTKASIFAQLSRQLLAYAKLRFHYRDLNTGNVLMRHGTCGEALLVLADHGNVRQSNRPRRGKFHTRKERKGSQGPLEDVKESLAHIIEDDARSINPMFEPTTSALATKTLGDYRLTLQSIESIQSELEGDHLTTGEILQETGMLEQLQADGRRLYRKMYTLAHRYCDDLESALYVFLWLEVPAPLQKYLELQLRDPSVKDRNWSQTAAWLTLCRKLLDKHDKCVLIGLLKMRSIIFEAQQAARVALEKYYDDQIAEDVGHNDEDIESLLRKKPEMDLTEEEERCMGIDVPTCYCEMIVAAEQPI
ncbi:hypothetical protein IE81DRAFT_350664 [Ceraceosorus guamensis]|uniref:Fungal-type protein kinase domain-containing protein n=1 Tax=Ceraceosorus guamensis TaxID=1522189 RepID=A0A316VR55_9BASI|nr:hypothetical protein IE81DRAFT_350664 [Ceraceosorus guamensis]PWN38883.1 hypothetical protein IE81DRAFT_350664 [Ceraceosorus guamensis]